MTSDHLIYITQIKSQIRCTKSQRSTLKGLGLKKIGATSALENTPSIRGMIEKVKHLVAVK